jgi:hypothetical protein
MYTVIKNPLHLKNCVIYKNVLDDQQFSVLSLLQIKQLLYLCHTYFSVLYELHYGTFLQQLRKIKVLKYYEHSK